MTEIPDRAKLVDCMFDPVTSEILAALEDGPKECSTLAEESSISESEVLERLDYLIEHNFIHHDTTDGRSMIHADLDKLNSIVEDGENFDAAISSLETMDSFLN